MSAPGWELDGICDSNWLNLCAYCGEAGHSLLACPHAPKVDQHGIACGDTHPEAQTLESYIATRD